jgi:NADP-dependent 3-hydroxy acid dehydrogenase YdfG
LVRLGAKVVVTSRSPVEIEGATVIPHIELTDNSCGEKIAAALRACPQGPQTIDILINNAGYFFAPVETIETLNFGEELKMIDICALGPLRVSAALINGGR